MVYITHVLTGSAVHSELRMTTHEAILAQFNPDLIQYNKHSKNFFNTKTFISNSPRPAIIPVTFLNSVARCTEYGEGHYTEFRIPKASGGTRLIEAPVGTLKDHQATIARSMYEDLKILPHTSVFAYSRGRCALDALIKHQQANARWFLKIDIKNFFPSITRQLLLDKLPLIYPLNGLTTYTLTHLSHIAVNGRGVLPQGSPLSPMLSNLIMMEFDHKLTQKLKRFNHQTYTYTRYADDLLITCPYSFRYQDILDLVTELFQEFNLPFEINYDKLRYASMSGRNWNLGLMYNQDQRITVGTKYKRMLHSLVCNLIIDYRDGEYWSIPQVQELIGKLSYLKNIEPTYYQDLIDKYERKFNVNLSVIFKELLN
jgi:RNA-directed DNA polymerase